MSFTPKTKVSIVHRVRNFTMEATLRAEVERMNAEFERLNADLLQRDAAL